MNGTSSYFNIAVTCNEDELCKRNISVSRKCFKKEMLTHRHRILLKHIYIFVFSNWLLALKFYLYCTLSFSLLPIPFPYLWYGCFYRELAFSPVLALFIFIIFFIVSWVVSDTLPQPFWHQTGKTLFSAEILNGNSKSSIDFMLRTVSVFKVI